MIEPEDQLIEEKMKEEEGHPMGLESPWPAWLYGQNGMCVDWVILYIFLPVEGVVGARTWLK